VLGALPSTPVRTALAQAGTAIYFLFFLAMPWYTRWESTKPVPARVTK
ncbi:MAG: cytochrome b, partial [Gammaproteobacteria bacterium]|nr:cytochrome b [Gammaproteobacteria bacterium]